MIIEFITTLIIFYTLSNVALFSTLLRENSTNPWQFHKLCTFYIAI